MELFGYEANLDLTIKLRPDYILHIRNPVKPHPRTGAQIDFDYILDMIHEREVRRPAEKRPRKSSILAEGVYPKGGWQEWVTQQGRIWIDRKGNIHLIEKMDKDYCLNVIQFLYESHPSEADPCSPLMRALRKRLVG